MTLRNLGLGIKLNLLLLPVFGVLLLSTILLLVSNTQNLTREVGVERSAEEVNITRSRLNEVERGLIVDINFIASSVPFFQAVGRRSVEDTSELIAQANLSLELDDVDVIDGDGNRLVDLRGDMTDEENRTLQLALAGTESATIMIEESEGGIEVSVTATMPVTSTRGNVLGAIQLSRRIDDAFLRELTFERRGVYLGLIYDGHFLARSTQPDAEDVPAGILHRDIAFNPSSATLAENGQTIIASDLVPNSEVPSASAYIPVAANATTSPAVMMVLVEVDEIYAFQNATLLNTIIVFVVLTLLSIAIISIVLYRVALRPIDRLKTIAQQMTGGQYDQRIPITTHDELGQLGETFNEMASAIEQRETSLKAAREQAERADAVKSAFLASVSHELRTPLNAIINFTIYVRDGDTGDVNPEQVELLDEVIKSARHLLSLINDVLDISKIEADSLKLFIEDNVDLKEILNSVTTIGRGLIGDKPVQLKTKLSDELPAIRGDQQRIYQILLNIMSNACKFTSKGEITLAAERQNDEVLISISDTGPGIAPEEQELVFQAFKQTKAGLQQGAGTGLGMAIARSLAEAHGGRLWLTSELGRGSTFYVALPIQSAILTPTFA